MVEDVVLDDDNNIAATETVATAHGVNWVRATIDDPPLNGNVPQQMWSVHNSVGDVFTPGGNAILTQDILPLNLFLLMFPPKQLTDMVRWTNVQLLELSLRQITASEMLKFFGVIILTTKFEFMTRASVWYATAWSKY